MQETNKERKLIGEEFEFSLKMYLNYVQRKIKKDENYTPHPLVRALAMAFQGAEEKGIPGTYMGLSGNGNKYDDGEPRQSFAAVIEKHKNGTFSILDITDLTQGSSVPIEAGIYVLTLSVKMDKLPGETLSPVETANLINETIPQFNMIPFNNEEWVDAREHFKTVQINIPKHLRHIDNLLSKITFDTKWEDYHPTIRTMIGQSWINDKYPHLFKENCINIVLTTGEGILRKETVLENVLIQLYGKPSDFYSDQFNWTYFKDLNPPSTKNSKKIKVSRNKPCPCGSGIKHKKCCGKS